MIIGQRVEKVGAMQPYCCETMAYHLSYQCEEHPDAFECPDKLIYYSEETEIYGLIIHDGGSSFIAIKFCPWCGAELGA